MKNRIVEYKKTRPIKKLALIVFQKIYNIFYGEKNGKRASQIDLSERKKT
jgi:hypothetical protein